MNRKSRFFMGSVVIVAAVGYLIYSAARETSAYYLTMEEYAAEPAKLAGRSLRLAGRVASGTVKWDPKTLDLAFVVEPIPPKPGSPEESESVGKAKSVSAEARLPVAYNGILPDMFGDGRDVIVEGKVESGVFHAKSLLTTCPSKYEADQAARAAEAPNT